ncbi:MAG TPA: phosphoglycerate dehydrogenase [Opitutales bacterium]|jgi:D-3-phosphoglycerate dehydrogenase|nr:phosphoglycerate dehydrogenase [Opitutales bacterium]
MKILVADKISPSGVAFFKQQPGFEVIEAYGSKPEQILALVRDVDAIAVRSETQITREVIAAATKLKAVGRAGVGVDNIDVEAATERGIIVMNTPSGNTIATAELTFTHMLCGARPIVQAGASMKAGQWDKKSFAGSELMGKTLGVCGLGRIGAEVAKRALAFGMKVLAYDPYLTAARAKALNVEMVVLEDIFTRSHYITVHMPLTEDTKYMVDEAAFAKMKKGVRIFNCARGGIIKESALVAALESGHVATAGLDVFEDEPLPADHPLRKFPNVVLTPHLGASTKEAQESVGIEVAEALTEVLNGGVVRNAVNMPSVDAHTLAVLRPYLALGEKLGAVLQQAAPDKIEKLRITYFGKINDLDANPLTRAIQRGYLRRISGADVTDVNAPLRIQQLGIAVETIKSTTPADYTELVQLEAIDAAGHATVVSGTLIGTAQNPRLVGLLGHSVEVTPAGYLLVLRNRDVPGIVGMLGTVLGKHQVNIANMSLSRSSKNEALAVYQLDSRPSEDALKEIRHHPAILGLQVITV